MNDEKLWLRELTENDGLDGLKYLQDIVKEEGIMVAPAPKDIDETTYPEWLKTKANTAKGKVIFLVLHIGLCLMIKL